MPVTGGLVSIIEAVREFLEDGTFQGSASPAVTLNGALAARRAGDGVDEKVVPDVAIFNTWWPPRSASGRTPSASIIPAAVQPEERNQRTHWHHVDVFILVAPGDVNGGPAEITAAGAYIADEVLSLLQRRTQLQEGNTLNGGGTGDAAGKVQDVELRGDITPDFVNGTLHAPVVEWLIPLRIRARRTF